MRSTAHRTIVLLALFVLGPFGGLARAQAPAPPPTPATPAPAGGALWAIGIIIALLVVVGLAVKLFDLRRKREAEAVQLQAQISDALLRDPAFFGLPVVANADVPLTGGPARIEIVGQVPNEAIREAVLRLAHAEASRIRADFTIEDRLAVVPTLERHVA
jgi:hypothetical protein